jgi:hypothetical protein
MNNHANFASILDESPTEVVRPKPVPEGTYLVVVGQYEEGKSSQKKTPFWKFPLRPLSPLDDVDVEALAEVGGLEGKNLSATFYLTPDAIFMFDDFFANCGGDLNDGLSRRMRASEVTNCQVLAVVKHRLSEDNTQTFAEVRRFAPAD